MRTTLRLNDHLLWEAKQHAAKTGKTLTELMTDALRALLSKAPHLKMKKKTPAKLITFHGKGLQEGVDLDDTSSLLNLMEGKDK